ncbi:putative elongator complex protein 1 [Exophiala xenobiotica]|uniref:Elongator complex protein 1 n=1 Tax=Lithohypha guttulata TaxID=1690604 RepID=A0ABR0KAP9_9EURO|nr:putative elongator complex protein 1 [Lithohypha guttulata]KAK5318817.1 putative elongator complex protein 1 [Exophiala xenobiotica]
MRNLSIAEIDQVNFGSLESGLSLSATTFDSSTNDSVCAFGPSASKPVIELRRCPAGLQDLAQGTLITSWDAPCPLPDLECDDILSLHYFHETSSICIVLAGGDLILVREKAQPDQERIEIVGSIDVGISAAQWSWNASFLAVITRTGSFVLMSQQLEPLNEVTLQHDDLNLSKHVSVGWGKKETQFQGKRAKALKDPTMPEFIDEGKPSPNDDGKTTISWRGDGAYIAVNSTIASSRRVIRVYSAEGSLDSVSEPVDGLESSVSWRPYGNLIAGLKRTLDGTRKAEVVFFERNGLRHGHFDLRLNGVEMSSFGASIHLCWNSDSSILAVQMLDRVQLWTMSNYHYYLKQEIRLKDLRGSKWHPTDPLQLSMWNAELTQSISLDSRVDRGSTCPPFDYGLVTVIDGKKLKLTPLKHVNMPPPGAYIEIEADENIIACAISRTCQRLAFLTHSQLYLCRLDMRQASSRDASVRHTETFSIEKKDLAMFPRPTQLVIQHDDQIFLLAPARDTSLKGQAFCHQYTWVATTQLSSDLRTLDVQVPRNARQILVDSKHDAVWVRADSEIVSIDMQSHDRPSFAGTSLSAIAKLQEDAVDLQYGVSLTKTRVLEVNGVQKATQVTSFAVTDAYLAYTTSNHLLKFAHLADGSHMSFPTDEPEVDERCRAIERVARIVTVIPSIYAVVLQMPRGNIETVYPRLLVVTGIRTHIRNLDYRKAFVACQAHQVDLNILYDLDPQSWTANIDKFIDQLKKPGRVDEFIQKLKGEDVTQTLYRDTSKQAELAVNGTSTSVTAIASNRNKVNTICDNLISALAKKDAMYLTNIITAHVCKRPPDVDAALTLVSSLRRTSSEEADLAVAHLCFLTDTNRLYDAALALYDLELTLLVAQNAQRDPREYMPFLQNLQSLPELRRKYTIDNHLKKYARALDSLHTLGEHEEVEAYTTKHGLYIHASNLYSHAGPHLQRITRLHADYLSSQSQHAAAATLYESLSDHESAYPLYALAHQWREALTCACLVPLTTDKISDLARSLATTLVEEIRDYRSAATIYLDYLSEALTAAELLCKSSYFAEATRILSMPSHNLTSQIPSVIDASLTRKFGEILELVADCQAQLTAQVPRIEELRLKKAEDPLAFFGGDAEGVGAEIPDNVSLAPTDASTLGGQSMFTRYGGGAGGSQASTKFGGTLASNMSRKTSKTKRREERKRARGKKGSVYEEEYLVASVGRLIERVNGVHEEVGRLVLGLRRRGLREQAEKVKEVMDGIQSACEDAKGRVWVETAKEGMNGGLAMSTYDVDGQGRPSGADGVLYDSQMEAEGVMRSAPEVKIWKGGL